MCEPVERWRKAKPTAAGRPPLLVLLHGRGADESDLFELGPAIDPRFAIASVRAPIAMNEGGYTWSESYSPGRYRAESLRASVTWIQSWLDMLKGGRDEPQPVYLLGFSAGMAMAAALLLDQPARYRGAVLLSGTLPFDADLSMTKNRLAGANVFYAHGSFNRVIPADLLSRSEKYLREASGARLTARRYPIAHEVSLAELQDINVWLAKMGA
ncbi:MAG: alpha/beta fold hydrolase [Candidatus Eremiobacteraeota bacterium]|nr:alpha/beta fold hydrolase [Candidatus Eremiobacteraeota bacterium]